MHTCPDCGKEFDSYRKLNGHKSIHRKGGRYSVSRRKKQDIHCIECGKLTDNPKFCSMECHQLHHKNITKKQIEEGAKLSEYRMRKYLVETKGMFCEECGIGDKWNDKPLVLQLDHIDGNSDNNILENLRLLCPNCHTQTETWCARNKKNSNRSKYARQWTKNIRVMSQMGRQ